MQSRIVIAVAMLGSMAPLSAKTITIPAGAVTITGVGTDWGWNVAPGASFTALLQATWAGVVAGPVRGNLAAKQTSGLTSTATLNGPNPNTQNASNVVTNTSGFFTINYNLNVTLNGAPGDTATGTVFDPEGVTIGDPNTSLSGIQVLPAGTQIDPSSDGLFIDARFAVDPSSSVFSDPTNFWPGSGAPAGAFDLWQIGITAAGSTVQAVPLLLASPNPDLSTSFSATQAAVAQAIDNANWTVGPDGTLTLQSNLTLFTWSITNLSSSLEGTSAAFGLEESAGVSAAAPEPATLLSCLAPAFLLLCWRRSARRLAKSGQSE
jgi:hypothetical protein